MGKSNRTRASLFALEILSYWATSSAEVHPSSHKLKGPPPTSSKSEPPAHRALSPSNPHPPLQQMPPFASAALAWKAGAALSTLPAPRLSPADLSPSRVRHHSRRAWCSRSRPALGREDRHLEPGVQLRHLQREYVGPLRAREGELMRSSCAAGHFAAPGVQPPVGGPAYYRWDDAVLGIYLRVVAVEIKVS